MDDARVNFRRGTRDHPFLPFGIGVILATAIGLTVSLLAPTFPATPLLWAVVAGLVTSLLVGIVAGYWPARQAARLDPVEALRYE